MQRSLGRADLVEDHRLQYTVTNDALNADEYLFLKDMVPLKLVDNRTAKVVWDNPYHLQHSYRIYLPKRECKAGGSRGKNNNGENCSIPNNRNQVTKRPNIKIELRDVAQCIGQQCC